MEQAQLVIFENRKERSMMCADVAHDWDNQKDIFGKETEKLLCTCQKLFRATMDHEEEDTERLLRKIYGIIMSGLYGISPDRTISLYTVRGGSKKDD